MREKLDEFSFGCGIFVDLQPGFDIEYYGIRGVCNDWFKLTCQIVNNLSINEYNGYKS